MLFLLSPAKSLDYESALPPHPHTPPLFVKQSKALIDVLRTHACNRIQGYWLSPPMPADACLAFLRERAGTAA